MPTTLTVTRPKEERGSRRARFGARRKKATPRKSPPAEPEDRVVLAEIGGVAVPAKVVRELSSEKLCVRLGIPGADGFVYFTDEHTHLDAGLVRKEVGAAEVAHRDRKVRRWQDDSVVSVDKKAVVTVKEGADERGEGGVVVDYRNVTFEGMGSTFEGTTARDRDGDRVAEGAFSATLAEFNKNPIMLVDHVNSAHQVAGSYSKVGQNREGLAVTGVVSDAPDLTSIRFKMVEGHLRALSMGGIFYFDDDDIFLIERVDLWEISVVAIPANQDALFSVRSITAEDVKRQLAHLGKTGGLRGLGAFAGKLLDAQPFAV